MFRLKEVIVFTLILSMLIQSVSAISNVGHSVDGNKVTLTYQGTPPFWINIRRDTNIGQNSGYLWAKTSSNSFTYDVGLATNPSNIFYYGVKDDSWSSTNQFTLGTQFQISKVLADVSEESGKPDQYYCSYDTSRNKVTVIIKENGIYDAGQVISKINQYFDSVKNHLNIDNVGVKKFNGSSISEMDVFIDNLVKDEYVGYIIFVGEDLPIVKSLDNKLILDYGSINEVYSYVGRTKTSPDYCMDVAISSVFVPLAYTIEEKRNLIISIFSNFVSYHNNPVETFNNYGNNTLVILWDDILTNLGMRLNATYIGRDLPVGYREKYFYKPVSFLLNTNYSGVRDAFDKGNLFLMYYVHGAPTILGLGLSINNSADKYYFHEIYTSNQIILDLYNDEGKKVLFVKSIMACGQDFISVDLPPAYDPTSCCWPQTWLRTGVWSFFTVDGDPYHNNFDKWLYEEKIIGKALRKTYHNQDMIYGDILGVVP